jgi:hypothetical protein
MPTKEDTNEATDGAKRIKIGIWFFLEFDTSEATDGAKRNKFLQLESNLAYYCSFLDSEIL